MGFSKQEYWSGLSFPPPGDIPDTGIESLAPVSPALQADYSPLSHWESPTYMGKTSKKECVCVCVCVYIYICITDYFTIHLKLTQ